MAILNESFSSLENSGACHFGRNENAYKLSFPFQVYSYQTTVSTVMPVSCANLTADPRDIVTQDSTIMIKGEAVSRICANLSAAVSAYQNPNESAMGRHGHSMAASTTQQPINFEFNLTRTEKVYTIDKTDLRRNRYYYSIYCIWLNLVFATVIPFVLLLFFNINTVLALKRLGKQVSANLLCWEIWRDF